MKARYQESKEESDGITLEDFDFSDDKHCVGKREDRIDLLKKQKAHPQAVRKTIMAWRSSQTTIL